MRTRPLIALASLCTALAAGSTASAQSCALLAAGAVPTNRQATDADREQARARATATLTERGVRVLSPEEFEARAADTVHAACNELACARDAAANLEVDFAVLITVWAPQRRPASVSLVLAASDETFGGDAPVTEEGLEAAVEQALTEAYDRWVTARMGYIEVETTPPGASASLDGRTLGSTPLRRLATAGQHEVTVQLEGYTPGERIVDIEIGATARVDFTLAAEAEPEPAAPHVIDESHWANWLIGGGLIAGGILTAIAPIQTAARAGECTDTPQPGYCAQEVRFEAVSGALTGISVALAAAGVVVLALQPLRVQVTVGPTSATLRAAHSF